MIKAFEEGPSRWQVERELQGISLLFPPLPSSSLLRESSNQRLDQTTALPAQQILTRQVQVPLQFPTAVTALQIRSLCRVVFLAPTVSARRGTLDQTEARA